MDAIYARQSVEKRDSISIETQIKFGIRESNALDGYKIFKDKGFSGKNMKRPDFQKMMQEVKNGSIKRIIVYKMDRFSRSLLDFAETWNILQHFGVEFVSINEKFDTATPMGRAMLFIIMVFAQLERETIIERCMDNYYERIKNGVWPGGPAPFGFQNSEELVNGKKYPTLTADSDLKIMIENFKLYAEDEMSLGKIAKKRVLENIKTNQKIVWNNVSLSRLLRSPVYVKADILVYMYLKEKGFKFSNPVEEWDGTKAAHIVGKKRYGSGDYRTNSKPANQTVSLLNIPGVIDSSLWLKCNRKLDRNGQIKNSGTGKHTWLTGLAKCGYCGYSITIGSYYKKKDHLKVKYMRCSGHTNLRCCDVKRFPMEIEEIEMLVQKELEQVMKQSEKEEMEEVGDSTDEEKKIQIVKIEEKIDRLIQAIGEAAPTTMKYINEEIEKLDQKKKEILGLLENQSAVRKKVEPIIFSKLEYKDKKKVAQNYIKRVEIFNDRIEIIWKM